MKDNLYCIECKHYATMGVIGEGLVNEHVCGARGMVDIVLGERIYNLCRTMRREGMDCGPEGKLWELREESKKDE